MGVKPFLIGTRNAKAFLPIGVKILREGGSAIDAVEAAVRGVEDNPLDTSVGYGGIPNILGDVELDASIMDGRTLKTGAVGAVKHFKNPISIARKLMEEAHHVLLVGEGAEVFADAVGFERSELLTDYSKKLYEAFVKDALPDLDASFDRSRAGLIDSIRTYNLREWYEKLSTEHHGTVNVIGIDSKGDICTGVSTSGLALKFPGRLGDSPIIGAGNYADNKVGAAACTGRGELTIRLLSARMIVSYMQGGMSVSSACMQAMRDILALGETGGVSCVGMDNRGNAFAASTRGMAIYCYMDIESKEPEDRTGGWYSR